MSKAQNPPDGISKRSNMPLAKPVMVAVVVMANKAVSAQPNQSD
nr:hypothetical protein [Nostoc flagelliforme]